MEGNRNCLCERLYQEQTCLLVPAGWGYDAGREYSLADFRKITFIVAKENEGISRMLYQLCQEHDFEPDTIVAPDFETMMLWIEQGLGVAGSGEGHLGKDSPYITSLSIREFHPLWFAVGWNKDNYNPLIPEFVENLLKGMNS